MIFEKAIQPIFYSIKSVELSSRFRILLTLLCIFTVCVFISIDSLFEYSLQRLCGDESGGELAICYLKRKPLIEPERSLEDHLVNLEYELSYELYQDQVENLVLQVPTDYGILETHVIRSVQISDKKNNICDNKNCSSNLNINSHDDKSEVSTSSPSPLSSSSSYDEDNQSTQAASQPTTTADASRTLILIHGYGTTSVFAWRNVFAELMTHYDTVIALDLPGFGRSKMGEHIFDPNVDHSITTELYCQWLTNTQKLLNITSPPYIVGHSFGGYLSTQCVSRRPELASRLLIADVPGVFSANGGYIYTWFQFFRLCLPYSVVRLLGKSVTSQLMYFMGVVLNTNQFPLHRDYWLHMQLSPNMRSGEILQKYLYTSGFTAIGRGMALPSLVNISVPTTIIFGEKDFVSPPILGQFMSEVTGFSLTLIPNASHCPYQYADRHHFIQVSSCNHNQTGGVIEYYEYYLKL